METAGASGQLAVSAADAVLPDSAAVSSQPGEGQAAGDEDLGGGPLQRGGPRAWGAPARVRVSPAVSAGCAGAPRRAIAVLLTATTTVRA